MATKKGKETSSSADNATICAVLSYLLVGIIWYFADESMKKSGLARWHAKQGLALLLGAVVVNIAFIIVGMIPLLGMAVWLLHPIAWLCFLILGIMGIIGAIQGRNNRLPVFAEFADKFDF
jgi:uncharacterized membrane protein